MMAKVSTVVDDTLCVPEFGTIADGEFVKRVGTQLVGSAGTGGVAWGGITGTLSAQTDLQSALDLKAPLISPSFTTPVLGTPTSGTLTNCTGIPAPTSTCGVGASPNSSSTQQITHGLGRTPVVIRIYGLGNKASGSSATNPADSFGIWNASGNANINRVQGASAGQSSSTAFAIKVGSGATAFCSGVIGNVGATTFDIVWTESGTSDTTPVYLWEAQ